MKKILASLIALSMVLVMLASCGGDPVATTDSAVTTDEPAVTTTEEVPETTEPEVTTTEAPATTEEVVELEPYTDATVVYLATSGKGNGSAPDAAVNTMNKALDCLDLSKDCTVVVCDYYHQDVQFTYSKVFDGSVTVTSNYDGVDYRESGAEFATNAVRFVCSGKYIFKDIDFNLIGKFFFFIANHYPFTIDTGVKVESMNIEFNGEGFGSSFSIIGGHQVGQPVYEGAEAPAAENNADVNITVKSGYNINIGAFSRQIDNAVNMGTSTINIGGDAIVNRLYLTPCNKPFTSGTTIVNIDDNANVAKIYGVTSSGTAESLTVNWNAGTIGLYGRALDEGNELVVNDGVNLVYAAAVESDANFATVSASFDKVTKK